MTFWLLKLGGPRRIFCMSATELLEEIEQLPDAERLWLIRKILLMSKPSTQQAEETEWSRFSASQLSEQYGPLDSVYDRD